MARHCRCRVEPVVTDRVVTTSTERGAVIAEEDDRFHAVMAHESNCHVEVRYG